MEGLWSLLTGNIPVLVMMLVGVSLLVFEMYVPGFGAPGISGIALLALGFVLLKPTLAQGLLLFAILAANMFGIELSAVQLLTLVVSIMFASIGAGGVPGGSVFLLFMVLENMHLAPDQVSMIVALALGINPILDMFETCCNVTGDNVCTYIVGAPMKNDK